MNIDLLSKMVKELILDKNEVSLPGVGTFVSELVPSVFSDKGYTINPPYKRLSFRQKENTHDNSVIELYAKSNHIEIEAASHIVKDFLDEMKELLIKRKVIIFPGLGKLRATKENYFFFVADEDLDIYPEGFGLEPVSMKTHEKSISEVSETMASLRSILEPEENDAAISAKEERIPDSIISDAGDNSGADVNGAEAVSEDDGTEEDKADNGLAPVSEIRTEDAANEETPSVAAIETVQAGSETETTMSQNEPDQEGTGSAETSAETAPAGMTTEEKTVQAETGQTGTGISVEKAGTPGKTSATEAATSAENTEDTSRNVPKRIIIALIILAALALAAFMILSRTAPDFIDSILYTPEELEIIRY